MDKSKLLISQNTRVEEVDTIMAIWDVHPLQHHDRYLGLPSLVRRSKCNTFKELKYRVWQKLQGWKEKLLSQANREVLIKAVVQALPTYTMSYFLSPKSFCRELEGLFTKFWWGQCRFERKMHWISWSKLCSLNMGGVWF